MKYGDTRRSKVYLRKSKLLQIVLEKACLRSSILFSGRAATLNAEIYKSLHLISNIGLAKLHQA
ncbi:MAG: hypothetical protein BRC49_06825 [Cyanobacteria bacterium SW_10_48_33]|nr:MAG: hypothetical protein BRC49_06825 [Cyanobacteria bacterium SW_10_48_33]